MEVYMCKSHDFLCTILPPHILKKLAESEKHRERALRTIALPEHARGRRAMIGALLTGAPSGTLRRTIYDEQPNQTLPGTLVRGEGDPATADVAVNEAYDYSGKTYDTHQRSGQVLVGL